MSRRESRASLGSRQNDALYEFEAFKKKFLLANKHITKLNSTLSLRIEELNAQIHALNVENLRLRTSEIQLLAELKRERDKSRKVVSEAEAATQALTRHLNFLRSSLDIPQHAPTPPTPPSPKARHRPTESSTIPELRIARPPNVPGIDEEDEPAPEARSSPKRKSKTSHRLSASNLPLPTNRIPTPTEVVHMDLSVALTPAYSKGRKPGRRHSGLVASTKDLPSLESPCWSPVEQGDLGAEIAVEDAMKEAVAPVPPPKERKRRREVDDTAAVAVDAVPLRTKNRIALQPIDNTVHEQPEPPTIKDFLAAPTSEGGSSTTPEPEPPGGRERRARKSVVSYAEPSLKVKMRKPESATAEPQKKKRSSKRSSESPERRSSLDREPDHSPSPEAVDILDTDMPPPARSRKSRPQSQVMYHDDDINIESEPDEDYVPGGTSKKSGTWANVNVEGRRKATSRRTTAGGSDVGESSSSTRRHSMAV